MIALHMFGLGLTAKQWSIIVSIIKQCIAARGSTGELFTADICGDCAPDV